MKKRIINFLCLILGSGIGALIMKNILDKNLKKKNELSSKHLVLYLLMNEWVKLKQDGKCIADYFKNKGCKKIAIYGMNYVGETLYRELAETAVQVMYAIDKNADKIYSDINVYKPEDALERVDMIVVTPIFYYTEIEKELSKKVDCPIVSLKDIVYQL